MPRRFFLSPYRSNSSSGLHLADLGRLPLRRYIYGAGGFVALIVLILAIKYWFNLGPDPDSNQLRGLSGVKSPVVETPRDSAPAAVNQDSQRTAPMPVPMESEVRLPVLQRAVRMQVLNGCGVKGLAMRVSPALREFGFDVRETRNAGNFKYERSRVIDRIDRIDLAYAVADSLGISREYVSTEVLDDLADIDVTLIVGEDYTRLNMNPEAKE